MSERALAESARTELSQRLGSLEADLARVGAERRALAERVGARDAEFVDAASRLEQHEGRLRSLEAERARLVSVRSTLESERDELTERVGVQEGLLADITSQLEDRQETIGALEAERSRLKSERIRLDERLDALESERGGLKSERGELLERLGAHEATLAAVRSRLDEREQRVRSLEVERARLETERSELAERLGPEPRFAEVGPGPESPEEVSRANDGAHLDPEHPELRERLRSLEVEYSRLASKNQQLQDRLESGEHAPLVSGELSAVLAPRTVQKARQQLREKPLTVSVVMPTYNRAGILRRALSSALAQSYPALEVIVSDDGSTDGTEAMIREEFARELEEGLLRYVRRAECGGSSAARNSGLAEARGDVVAYLDSDNAWHEHFLLLMAATLSERDDVSTAYCGIDLEQDEGGSGGSSKRIAATNC